MTPSVRVRPDGPRLLAAIVARRGMAEVCAKLGCTDNAIRHWTERRRKPKGDARLALMEAYAIPIEAAWGELEEAPANAHPAPAPAPASAPAAAEPLPSAPKDATARERMQAQLQRLEQRIARADREGFSPKEVSALERSYTFCSVQFAKLSGELEVTEMTILRSSAFTRVIGVILEAAKPYPDAVKSIARALEGLRS